MVDKDKLRNQVRQKIWDSCPSGDSVEKIAINLEIMREATIIHPPLKFEGMHARMFAQMAQLFQEIGMSPKELMDFIWKCGVVEAHKHVGEIMGKRDG